MPSRGEPVWARDWERGTRGDPERPGDGAAGPGDSQAIGDHRSVRRVEEEVYVWPFIAGTMMVMSVLVGVAMLGAPFDQCTRTRLDEERGPRQARLVAGERRQAEHVVVYEPGFGCVPLKPDHAPFQQAPHSITASR